MSHRMKRTHEDDTVGAPPAKKSMLTTKDARPTRSEEDVRHVLWVADFLWKNVVPNVVDWAKVEYRALAMALAEGVFPLHTLIVRRLLIAAAADKSERHFDDSNPYTYLPEPAHRIPIEATSCLAHGVALAVAPKMDINTPNLPLKDLTSLGWMDVVLALRPSADPHRNVYSNEYLIGITEMLAGREDAVAMCKVFEHFYLDFEEETFAYALECFSCCSNPLSFYEAAIQRNPRAFLSAFFCRDRTIAYFVQNKKVRCLRRVAECLDELLRSGPPDGTMKACKMYRRILLNKCIDDSTMDMFRVVAGALSPVSLHDALFTVDVDTFAVRVKLLGIVDTATLEYLSSRCPGFDEVAGNHARINSWFLRGGASPDFVAWTVPRYGIAKTDAAVAIVWRAVENMCDRAKLLQFQRLADALGLGADDLVHHATVTGSAHTADFLYAGFATVFGIDSDEHRWFVAKFRPSLRDGCSSSAS